MAITSCVSTSDIPEKPEKPKEDLPVVIEEDISDLLGFYKGPEDADRALEILEKIDEEKMDKESRLIYFSLLMYKNKITSAREQMEILLNEDNSDIEALSSYVILLDKIGDLEDRNKYLDRLLGVDPENSTGNYIKGMIALRDKKYLEADRYFLISLKTDSENVECLLGQANALMHIEEREEESVVVLDKAEMLDPENSFIYSDRSRVLRFLKQYRRAEDDLSKAISINPSEWNYLDRARIRIENLRDIEGAKADLLEVLKMNDRNFFANVYFAGIYDEEEQYDLALEFYEKILDDTDDYYYAYPALGKLYYLKSNWAKAAEMYNKASNFGFEDMTYPLMASICYKLADDDKNAKLILNNNINKLDRKTSIYEMYRYYLNPGSSYFVQTAMDDEESEWLRSRMKYYLAMQDKFNGRNETAAVIFGEIAVKKGAVEFEFAANEMEKR